MLTTSLLVTMFVKWPTFILEAVTRCVLELPCSRLLGLLAPKAAHTGDLGQARAMTLVVFFDRYRNFFFFFIFPPGAGPHLYCIINFTSSIDVLVG